MVTWVEWSNKKVVCQNKWNIDVYRYKSSIFAKMSSFGVQEELIYFICQNILGREKGKERRNKKRDGKTI
jgi:hypothetical protein